MTNPAATPDTAAGAQKIPEGAHLDFSAAMSYGDYLCLDTLLSAQHPRSTDHNELLFVIQHQTTELWMKLMLHELTAAREHIRNDNLGPAFKMLSRVARIMQQLIAAWDVLSTMTPSEYSLFRPSLGSSSGFQSHQYRMLEFMLGNKNAALLAPYRHRADVLALVSHELESPSLYDEALRLLSRRGLKLDAQCIERDWTQAYAKNASAEAAWREVYRDPVRYWDLYDLAEKLVDMEDRFRQWRFRHVTTVERVIGFKRGTGGTAGVAYLQGLLELQMFPELWAVRTSL